MSAKVCGRLGHENNREGRANDGLSNALFRRASIRSDLGAAAARPRAARKLMRLERSPKYLPGPSAATDRRANVDCTRPASVTLEPAGQNRALSLSALRAAVRTSRSSSCRGTDGL